MSILQQTERPFTADDLHGMPEDGQHYEVLGGELIVSPAPSEQHQRVLLRLARRLSEFLEPRALGEVYIAPLDVYLGEHDVVEPDLLVVLREHRERIQPHGIVGPPDLVVEVISPGSRSTDRVRNAAAYATFGVREYWLVDPDDEMILAQELRDGRYGPIPSDGDLVRSVVLPGLTILPRDIFTAPAWLSEPAE